MPRARTDVFVHPHRRVRPDDAGVPGHVHRCCPEGLRVHCPTCDTVVLHPWPAVDALQLDGHSCVRVPQCPCGTITFLAVHDEQYEPDDPSYATQRVVHEHLLARYPRLAVARVRAPRGT